jgi:predicted esterase
MKHLISSVVFIIAVVPTSAADEAGPFQGEWRTTLSVVKLIQNGDEVTGTYGNAGQFSIKGTAKDRELTFEFQEGKVKGDGTFTLDDSGIAFTGSFQVRGGRSGSWNGWRPDPKATLGEPQAARFAGLWLTGLGLMELSQDGAKIKGRYASRGTSELEGDVTGRRLEFRFKSFRAGHGWFDLADDGKSLAGAANTDGFPGWFGWRGRPSPEFARHVKLVAGRVADGSTENLLTYAVRAPEDYREGTPRKWPAVLVLHGSNMDGRSYVDTIAAAWPDIARDFLLIGLNGEIPSNTGAEPRFNYSYVNFVGRSTFKGFAGTDRESPALVSEAMAELKAVYPIEHYLVGGHSQGGFLTYSLLMNYSEALAGAFPVSAGLIVQCEPDAYTDKPLRAAQRRVPLAIVHGTNDSLVAFSMGEYAATLFRESGWPAFRFFTDDQAAHMFARLPVGRAIRWLETLAGRDPQALLDFAESRLKENGYRDAIAVLGRARGLELDRAQRVRAETLAAAIDARASDGAKDLLAAIEQNKDGTWVAQFLAYRDEFEFAEGARPVMSAFEALRARHEEPAKAALAEARKAFQQGKPDDGYARYQEIIDRYYASPLYRVVKLWLAQRR